MAEVLAFPPARRIGYLRKQATFILGMNPEAGERHLARQLSLQRETLRSKGIDPAAVEAEVADLESALRGQLWRAVFAPGGAG